MKVAIGADHGGFEMKEQLAKELATEGHEVIDFGNAAYDPDDDYPDFAIPLARAVASVLWSGESYCAAAALASRLRRTK